MKLSGQRRFCITWTKRKFRYHHHDTLEAWWKELTAFERLVLQNDSYLYKTNIYDDVYVNGKIVRKDLNNSRGRS